MFNATTNSKILYKQALKRSEWWDNGVLPLWITAQNQVRGSVVLLELSVQSGAVSARSPAAPSCGRRRKWSQCPSGPEVDVG